MFVRKVRVLFQGQLHTVEVCCEPSTPLAVVERRAVAILQEKEEKRKAKLRERQTVFFQGIPIKVI